MKRTWGTFYGRVVCDKVVCTEAESNCRRGLFGIKESFLDRPIREVNIRVDCDAVINHMCLNLRVERISPRDRHVRTSSCFIQEPKNIISSN